MNLKNLPPFYIGQRVIYITGNNMPKNSIHTVTAIWKKPTCDCYCMDIDNKPLGYTFEPIDATHIICTSCGTERERENISVRIGWAAKSFRATEDVYAPLMSFARIIKREEKEVLINN